MVRPWIKPLAALLALGLLPAPAARSTPTPPRPAAVQPRPSAFTATPVPPAPVLLALLRGTLGAVNQANVTGNYSVLRDLGAPAFREKQSVATLADSFRDWRARQLDFAAVLLLDAKLTRMPEVDRDGMLRLAGFFPTAPLRIEFDLSYQPVDGHWRLAAISLAASDTKVAGDIAAASVARPSIVSASRDVSPPAYQAPVVPDRDLRLPTPPFDRPRG